MTLAPQATSTSELAPSPSTLSDLHLLRVPRGGVDRLRFETWDTFAMAGSAEPETVHLVGHYVIERADPSSPDWTEASVDIRMRELSVEGVSRTLGLGRIRASVNTEIGIPSGGQVTSGTIHDDLPDSPKLCIMEGYMRFDLPDAGVTVFNKEAIPLQHTITHIPPIGQGGGTPSDFEGLGLYTTADPDGPPLATLLRVKTHIGAWLDGRP
jgi:hypothetical protein